MKAPLLPLSATLLAGAMSISHCGGDDAEPPPPSLCVEDLNVGCTQVAHSPPVYSTLFSKLIEPKCALGTSCHGAAGAMGGILLANADDTYDTLLGLKGGTQRVIPKDPKCSPLMARLASRDPNFVMPRGNPLSEPELCNFVQWIKEGAQKN